MASSTGPDVITDGLVLALDAGDSTSYPGTGTTWSDLSGNGNNGTLVNGVGYDSGNGGSLTFDGVNDRIDTSYTMINGTDSSQPITISFFINPDSTQNAVTNNPLWIGSAYYSGFGLRYTGSTYQIWLRMTSGIYTDNITLAANTFQQVVLMWGGLNDSKLYSYVNGILNTQRDITYSTFNLNLTGYIFRIGFPYTTGGATASGYFKGKISNVQIYNRALTADEVAQNFNATRSRFGI